MSGHTEAAEFNPTILLAQEDLLDFASEVCDESSPGNILRLPLQNTSAIEIGEDLTDLGFEEHLVMPEVLCRVGINRPTKASLIVSFNSDGDNAPKPKNGLLTDSITKRTAECGLILPFSGVTTEGVLFTAEHWITLHTFTGSEPPYIGSGIEMRTYREILTDETIPISIHGPCALNAAKVFVKLSAKYYEANI